uniref:cytochrome P450 4C1-like n=1 Tax=Vespula vulgaris TaxID=7454 RepID=UPI00223C38DE|nr:cytochrome P450 4C1-like [Vespula vulgaris]
MVFNIITILIIITLILIEMHYGIVQYVLNKLRMYNKIKRFPGPKAYPIIGNAYMFLGNIEDITNQFLKISKYYQSLWRIWLGTKLLIMVDDPKYIENILRSTDVIEKSDEYDHLKIAMGDGLFSAPASKWKGHRKLLKEAFLNKNIHSHMNVFNNHSINLMEKLDSLVGEDIDVGNYVYRCVLDIIYDGMLDIKVNTLTNPDSKLAESIECGTHILAVRIFKLWLHADIFFYNTAIGKKFQKCLSYMDNITSNIMKKKKESISRNNINQELTKENSVQHPRVFLDLLFESSHEEGKYSQQDIRDEINTMIIAGSDTTTTTISFVFLMLASFPDIQNEVYEELNQIYGSNNPKYALISHDDTKRMKLLERVIKETLRLFPIGPVIGRKVTKDIEVEQNLTIPKGSSLLFWIFKLHRNKKYWNEPLKFDPNRFLSGNVHPHSFLPFGIGARSCLGQTFAMLEMKMIIATILRRFIIKIDRPVVIEDIALKLDITLKPAKPIVLQFERRN